AVFLCLRSTSPDSQARSARSGAGRRTPEGESVVIRIMCSAAALVLLLVPRTSRAVPVAGHVLDSATSAPVAGVEVRALAAERQALTDSMGAFVLDVPAGEVELTFFRV